MKQFLLTAFLVSRFLFIHGQVKITNITTRSQLPNLEYTQVIKTQSKEKAIVKIKNKDKNRLFIFSKGQFYERTVNQNFNFLNVSVFEEDIILNTESGFEIFSENIEDKKVLPSKILNYSSFYGLDKDKRLELINDTLSLIEGKDTVSLGFKIESYLRPNTIFSEKHYNLSVLKTTLKSYILESNGKIIYNGVIFPSSVIKDFIPYGLFFIGENLYHFDKNLTSICIKDNGISFTILNDTTKIISKISDNIYFHNDAYYELNREGFIKTDLFPVSEPRFFLTRKVGKYEIIPGSSKGLSRDLILKNPKNEKSLVFQDEFLDRKDPFYNRGANNPNNEYLRFTLLKDSLIRVENLKENHNYIFTFNKLGYISYFEELVDDSLNYHLLDVDANYFILSKTDFSFQKKQSIPIKKHFSVFTNSPGLFSFERDSLYFPDINLNISKNGKTDYDTLEYNQNVYYSNLNLFPQVRYSSNNNFFLHYVDKSQVTLYNRKSKDFKNIVFAKYELIAEPLQGLYAVPTRIFFLENDVLLLSGRHGYVAFIGNETKSFPSVEFGSFSLIDGQNVFKTNDISFVLDEKFYIKYKVKNLSFQGAGSEWYALFDDTNGLEVNRKSFTKIDKSKNLDYLFDSEFQTYIGNFNNHFVYHKLEKKEHMFYVYIPEKSAHKVFKLNSESTFFSLRMYQNIAYFFDSQDFRIIKYDLAKDKCYEMKNVLPYDFLGRGLKARKDGKVYYINYSSKLLEIINVSELGLEASINNIQLDYFSEGLDFYFLGNSKTGLQVFKSKEVPKSIDDFEWIEIEISNDLIIEKDEIKVFPNPYEKYLFIYSNKAIYSFNIVNTVGEVLYMSSSNSLPFSNFEVEKEVNDYLLKLNSSQLLILNLYTDSGIQAFRIFKK